MLDELKMKWNDILEYMKDEYDLSSVSFDTWLAPLRVHTISNNTVYIIVPNEPDANYIRKRYSTFFKVAINEIMKTDHHLEVSFILEEDAKKQLDSISPKPQKEIITTDPVLASRIEAANIRPEYTFDTFIVGNSNRFAQSYALRVAEDPGNECNPLFLYGGVGLGKTHLMHSIAHYILEHDKTKRVLYVTSEKFTNDLIKVIRHNENHNDVVEFRKKYRDVDVLMIDDIQFIIGKDRCQEEFFHTFNDLYNEKKQIVLSSDKPPKDMTTLEERLRTRFSQGLTVDISQPDYETRMAILQKKSEQQNFSIDDEILAYIADNVVTNIRELEGALNRIIKYSLISPSPITLDLAKDILKDTISQNTNLKITSELIIKVVAEHYNITTADISSKRKNQNIALPRQVAMYLCRELTEDSYSDIGKLLGGKDHTTIIHGYEKIESLIKTDVTMENSISVLKKKLLPN